MVLPQYPSTVLIPLAAGDPHNSRRKRSVKRGLRTLSTRQARLARTLERPQTPESRSSEYWGIWEEWGKVRWWAGTLERVLGLGDEDIPL